MTPTEPAEASPRRRRLVITGAGGAVGHCLVPRALAAGWDVIAVDLPDVEIPCEAQVEVRRGDLRRRRFCRKAVEGGDVIINAAAEHASGSNYEAMTRINVDAARWLYEAAEQAGARRFVHLSTADTYRPRRGVLLEDSPIDPRSSYAATKAEAERYLRSRAWSAQSAKDDGDDEPRAGALPCVILRPSLSYGPRSQYFTAGLLTVPPLLRMFFAYVPALTGGARNNWVHVEDIASAALFVAEHPDAPGEIFNVADDTPLAYGEILSAVIQAYGLKIGPTIGFPIGLIDTLRPFIDSDATFRLFSRLIGPLWSRVVQRYKLDTPLKPRVHRAGLAFLEGDRVVVTDKLKALGWRPLWPDLREGIVSAMRWYQQARWVPDYQALPEETLFEESIGLSYRERLTCQRELQGALSLTVVFPSARRLAFAQDAIIQGTVTLEGVATDRPVVGTLKVHKARRDMVYDFAFTDDAGRAHRFHGHKHLTLLGMVSDFARLEGLLFGAHGQQVAALSWRMNLREDLGGLLTSLRFGDTNANHSKSS